MRAINITDQIAFPIDQPLRSFCCCVLRLFQRRVAQLHILNRLPGGGEIIKSDLLSVIGERCVPWSGLKSENLFFVFRAGSICWLWIYCTTRWAFVLRIELDRRNRCARQCAGRNMRARCASKKKGYRRQEHDEHNDTSQSPPWPSPAPNSDMFPTLESVLRVLHFW